MTNVAPAREKTLCILITSEDDDLAFLPECSEAHLEAFTRILTHGENGKPRLSSTLLRNETFLAMEGHPERYRRNWQLIAGELQHFGGDSIANTLRRHGKFYRAILLDVCKRLKAKVDKQLSTPQIEQQLLAHFLQHSWNKLNAEQKAQFLAAVECRSHELDSLMAHLLRHRKLSEGVTLLLDERLTAILRTHAAVSVIGHGLGARRRAEQRESGERQRLPGHHPRGPAYRLFTANAPAAVRHRGNW